VPLRLRQVREQVHGSVGASVWLVGRSVASLVRVREHFSEALLGGSLPINSGAVRIVGISSKHDPVMRE